MITRMSKLIHEELSGVTIRIALEVLNELKPGLDETGFFLATDLHR
jgi:hypothetical protein